ncbi:MAG: hypothetical protein IBJ10_09905 [Phycisphaerales bacterium]|nr:hypothetical protein [Phycisphaerales bacterium]
MNAGKWTTGWREFLVVQGMVVLALIIAAAPWFMQQTSGKGRGLHVASLAMLVAAAAHAALTLLNETPTRAQRDLRYVWRWLEAESRAGALNDRNAAAARSRDRADALVTHVAARFEANPMLRVRSGLDARAAALVAADHTGTEPALALIRSLMIEAEGAPPVIAHEYNSVARIALRSQSPEVRLAARRALLGWFTSSPLDDGIRLGAVAGVFDDAIVVGDLTAEEAASLSAVLIPIAADDPSTLSFNLLSSLAEARLIPTELLNLLVTTLQGRVETQQQHSHAWSTLRVIGACTTDDRIRDRVVAVFVRAVAERQAPYSESGFYARAVAQRWTTPEQNLVLFLSAQSRGLFSESALRRHTAPGLHEAICQAAAAEPVKFAALHPNAWTWILNERREERLTPDQSRTIDEASATLEARRTERGRGSSP